MGIFSFIPGPTASGYTPNEFMQDAYEQPFSMSSTALSAVAGAAMESPGLGTFLKEGTIDQGRGNTVRDQMLSGGGLPPELLPFGMAARTFFKGPADYLLGDIGRETDAEIAARGDKALTADEYKASPSFRAKVPYDDAMTVNRAAALAAYDDRRSMREEMARRRPWTAFAGSFAGSALDPVNYIPVFGEASAGASIGARVIRSSADAAANVGLSGLLSAPERARYGDDVSWQSQVSAIAMGAAIGGAFGAVGGALHGRAVAREARAAAIKADVESRLSTVRAGQDSIATLAEAVEHLKNDGEISLGDASIDRIDDLQGRMADALPQSEAKVIETPEGYAARALAATMPDEVRTLAQHDAAIAENVQAVDAIKAELQDPRFEGVRQADQQARALDAERQTLATQMEAARSADQRAQLAQQVKAVEAKIDAISSKVDTATMDRFGELNREMSRRSTELKAIEKERAPVASKVETARQQYLADHAKQSDTVRFYHGGHDPTSGGGRWVTTDPAYARDFRSGGTPNPVHFVDIPRGDPTEVAARAWDEMDVGTGMEGRYNHIEVPEEWAKKMQPLNQPKPSRTVLATKPKPETVQPEATKAAASVGKPETGKAMAETYGVDPETGAIPEDFELKQIEREGRLPPGSEDARAMETANDNFEIAKSWGEALRAAVACLI